MNFANLNVIQNFVGRKHIISQDNIPKYFDLGIFLNSNSNLANYKTFHYILHILPLDF